MIGFLSKKEFQKLQKKPFFLNLFLLNPKYKQWWGFNYDSIIAYQLNTEIVALLLVNHNFEHHEIIWICTHPNYQKQKIATQLLNFLNKWILKNYNYHQIWLEVKTTNFIAIKMYKKLGFKINRIRKNYYADGGDAWEMKK